MYAVAVPANGWGVLWPVVCSLPHARAVHTASRTTLSRFRWLARLPRLSGYQSSYQQLHADAMAVANRAAAEWVRA